MDTQAFIKHLELKNFSLAVDGDKLLLKGAKGNQAPVRPDDFIINYIKANKQLLIDHLLLNAPQETVQTPSKNIEAIYKLSGLQEGILFHSLYDGEALNYTNQFTATITNVDLDLFIKSWAFLLKKYSILRSAFFYDSFKVPVQGVYKNVNIPVEIIDVSDKDEVKIDDRFKNYLKNDRQKGFEYRTPPLMRLTFFKVSDRAYKMIWTFHHLLFDGWSLPILIGEGLKTYEQLLKGIEPKIEQVDNFHDYIKYLDSLDKEKEEKHWKTYLAQLDHGSLLPFTSHTVSAVANSSENLKEVLTIDAVETARLVEFTQQSKVTVNTLMQAVWSYLLAGYTNSDQVVFGVIVSGRPAELPFVEQRVGMYINTLPLFAKLDGSNTIADWLVQIQTEQITSRQYQYTPLKKVKTWTGIKEDLFDSLLVFENYPVDQMIAQSKWSLEINDPQFSEQTNYPLTILVGQTNEIVVNFQYDTSVLSATNVQLIKAHFKHVLGQITSKQAKTIADLNLLTPNEQHHLLHDLAGASVDYRQADVVKMFEENVLRHPEKLCLLHEENSLTYRAFNANVNRLANYLQAKGVKNNVLVGVYMNRTPHMVTAMLAIIKAGGAYVPIDVSYPIDRVKYQLEDSAAAMVLTDAASTQLLQNFTGIDIVRADNQDEYAEYSAEDLHTHNSSTTLAYVMYTSGSTGRPKGVMIEHSSVRAFVGWSLKEFGSSPFDIIYAGTSISFDLSVFELFYGLSAGKTIRLLQNGLEAPNYLQQEQNILLNTVPSVIESLLKEKVDLSNVTVINMAGEPISAYVQQHLDQQNIEVRNLYGPTEDTTYSTVYRMHKGLPLLIGKPIDNTNVYILNDHLQLVPIGVTGEICIGGQGLARGYLNNPRLTEEKFIQNPFSISGRPNGIVDETQLSFNDQPAARLYKTGDVGRWLADGNIEYLGRKDEQVKISGYRIELGEIENVLLQSGMITQAVVTAQPDANGNKKLVAYLVDDKAIEQSKLTAHLSALLPAYMVPNWFVQLNELPLTSNGKVDKKALPQPDVNHQQKKYIAPTTQMEQALVTIWQDLLGIEQIGVDDNFFELGGDSILTIQAVSRAAKQGFNFKPRDIFVHQTVRKICDSVTGESLHTTINEQGILTGPAPLLPIQQSYLQAANHTVSHYNQAVLLAINKKVGYSNLQNIMTVLANQHDSLRFKYQKQEDGWHQLYGTGTITLEREDVSQLSIEALATAIKLLADDYHKKVDIENGRLVQAVLMETPAQETDNRLLIVVHHLAVDGVSWRILLEDMETLLSLNEQKRTLELPAKKTSYRQWYQALAQHGTTNKVQQQKTYWLQQQNQSNPLQTDFSFDGEVTAKHLGHYQATLPTAQTQHLLQGVAKVYSTEINDLLLAALAQAFTKQQRNNHLLIGLESHGREEIDPAIDINNTVGWFTTLYPVVLNTESTATTGQLIKSVKEQLRKIPGKGLGYGVLKYINAEPELQGAKKWEIVFNYLGQLDNVLKGSRWLSAANEPVGSGRSNDAAIHEKISINAQVQDAKLVFTWSYSTLHFKVETIEKLAASYVETLTEIIQHCLQLQQSNVQLFTPSDVGLADQVDYQELDKLLATPVNGQPLGEQISSLYPLSGLQQGMLFHSLFQPGGAYIEQFTCFLPQVDLAAFSASWQAVLDRHSILRSAFFYDVLSVPVQCVFNKVLVPIQVVDMRHIPVDQQRQAIKDFELADLANGFDYSRPPLMRLSLLQLSQGFRMVWTYHHLLTDGWSLPILFQEFLEAYDHTVKAQPVVSRVEDKYEDYIRYLQQIDHEQEELYWRKYLQGVSGPTLLPFISSAERNKVDGKYAAVHLQINEDINKRLHAFAQQNRLTINSVMQGLWAWLLSCYTGQRNVAYGIIVSGRPESLVGVEQRVGLYINTLPLHTMVDKQMPVINWLQQIQQDQVNNMAWQHTPLQQLQNWSGVNGSLFDTILVFENYPVSKLLQQKQWSLQAEDVQIHEQTNYPLNIIIQSSGTLQITFSYNSSLVQPAYVNNMRNHFEQALLSLVDGAQNTGDLQWMGAADTSRLLDYNQSAATYEQQLTLAGFFERQVHATPNNIAVVDGNVGYTYLQLNEQANQLAHYLCSKGVQKESLVPICLHRGAEVIIAMLAILKAGAAYIPVDPAYPQERIAFMLSDTNARLLISHSSIANGLTSQANVILIDGHKDDICKQPVHNLVAIATSHNLAYVIYTSGSTGKPKGVMIEHRSVINLVTWHNSTFDVSAGSKATAMAGIGFDAFGWEVWPYLCCGASVHTIDNENRLSLEYLVQYFEQNEITHSFISTAVVPGFVDRASARLKFLRYLLTGGDKLSSIDITNLNFRIVNNYGPTENTVVATYYELQINGLNAYPPIGKPIANTVIKILDKDYGELPEGVEGEIFIGGDSLARGYFNRPELTKERFVTLGTDNTTRWYKTGDHGRWLPGGNIEYTGRVDEQVKVRGYRIELGEIETALLQSGLVNQAFVTTKDDTAGNKSIFAFVVCNTMAFDKQALTVALLKTLPEYMIPAVWVPVDQLPLTANGKIDKKALLDLETGERNNNYVAPQTDMELKLAAIWQELLGIEKVGIFDNFFELGGNSLLAMRMVSYIERKLLLSIPIPVIFQSRSIHDLSKYFEIQSNQEVAENTGAYEVMDL